MPEHLTLTVAQMLTERGKKVAVAEATACGMAMASLASIPGASRYFLGGIVAYGQDTKADVLHVPPAAMRDGAVSPAAAEGMATRVREMFRADIGLADSGIAGPTGGTDEKPVGLVYVALSAADAALWERHTFHGERAAIQQQTVQAAFDLLRRYLLAIRPR
ncbi:MAG: CinA family protein [Dehalococcoidia bacterium]|nr:CinA family protein [Dehalococcoidia bacterium]